MRALPKASLTDNAAFNALVVVPNVVQGLFRRRSAAVKAATAGDIDSKAVGLLAGMSRRYHGGPVWVRMGLDEALLLLDPADVNRVLEGSTDDYAADPEAKRKGMVHFQPDALTISRGDEWRSRRHYADTVLSGVGPLAGRITEVVREEVDRLLADSGGALDWPSWNSAIQRVTRRVVLGDAAAGDWALTDTLERMMGGANSMPGQPSGDLDGFQERVAAYLDRADGDNLAGILAETPLAEGTSRASQVTHWLFALGDTLAANALRTLVVLANAPDYAKHALADDSGRYLDACINDVMRLWPTTPMLSRETLTDIAWTDDETIPAGTQVVIVNTYCHRDPDRVPFADRFAPEEWLDGDAAGNPAFNHFSRGPQGCPGSTLALLVGRTALRTVLDHKIVAQSPSLAMDKPLPHMLNFFAIQLTVG